MNDNDSPLCTARVLKRLGGFASDLRAIGGTDTTSCFVGMCHSVYFFLGGSNT